MTHDVLSSFGQSGFGAKVAEPLPHAGQDRPAAPAARIQPVHDAGALDTVSSAFAVLVSGPGALAIDGREIGAGLPPRLIVLDELTSLLLHPSTGYETRDAVWAHVVTRARSGESAWIVAAVGLGLPGLRRMAGRLSTRVARDQVADLESEMLAGYLGALKTIDLETGRIASRLCWAAYRAADKYRSGEPARSGVVVGEAGSMPPPRPWGHPDFVLARAVTDGILSDYEAELIARTRLENLTLQALAAQWALPLSTLADDRARAEGRLLEVLDPERPLAHLKVTDRSRSRTAPENGPSNPDSEDVGAAPTAAPANGDPTHPSAA